MIITLRKHNQREISQLGNISNKKDNQRVIIMKVKIHSTNWDEQMTIYGESLNQISHSNLQHFLNKQTLPKKKE